MSGEKSSHDTALELLDKYNGYSDEFIELYNLKTFDQEEINKLYNAIKTKLIDSKLFLPSEVIFHTFAAMPYNIRYSRSYWTIFKKIYEEYHPDKINIIHPIIHYFFYKEYGIIVHQKLKPLFSYFDKMHYTLEVHEENTLYRAIMEDDINAMISFTKKKGFDKNQALCHEYYPESPLSLFELCCYHGSLQCFNYLRSEFKSKITMKCLHLACLGGNKDILTECMHERRPD